MRTIIGEMHAMSYAAERRAAVEAVLKACRLCQKVQANLVTEDTLAKKDKSPVTVADYGAQAVVCHDLMTVFPDDPMVGEEDAKALRDPANAALKDQVVRHVREITPGLDEAEVLKAIDRGVHEGGAGGRHWTLDPIDGTKGFLRGDQYAVALALIENGEVVLGVLGCPNLPHDGRDFDGSKGCVFIAEKDSGAFMRRLDSETEERISVTGITDPSEANFCESVESAHSSQDDSAKVAEKLGITAPPYRIDSQCKYAAVSRGDASIYLRLPTKKGYEEKIWDHAAGVMVIREAGGRVTDCRGDELDFSIGRTLRDNLGVVVTNGKLHDPVVRAVREVLELND
ncbi:MAG: 3'(2'),5'-bisphosphate nucleotidase [Phycisphaerales bacterium]